ncbi:Homocysteine S-methyltransferase [Mycotypha africana]|uniref:Homocysteine S-methyltransferase n=1 Tax=Mycotypha africana TaxID=64632 RepID=UPI002300963B|nr:Homocysteine S-methyltransferase [Mycotypha africana]KAI8971615.1 Homocysteine S-methyltransferase [Mycotypha africana]
MSFQYPLILDGGLATELERTFKKNLSGTSKHSRIIRRNNPLYQASIDGFIEEGLTKEQAIKLMHESILLACEARDEYMQGDDCGKKKKLVALSIGCYGAVLANGAEYTGNYGATTVTDLINFHKERLSIFLNYGYGISEKQVDFILFETIPSLAEVQAIGQLVEDWANDNGHEHCRKLPPVAVSVQCRSNEQIADGSSIIEVLKLLNEVVRIFAVGFNCTKPRYVETLFSTIAEFNKAHNNNKAIIAYPDGGEEWNETRKEFDEKTKFPEERFGQLLTTCVEKYGPRVIVGGCCGTSPRHIMEVVNGLSKMHSS